MKQITRTLLTVLCTLCSLDAIADEPNSVRLLFAGSSSTYWNDMPREVAKAVDRQFSRHPGTAVLPEIVGRSGSDIRVYLEPGFNSQALHERHRR